MRRSIVSISSSWVGKRKRCTDFAMINIILQNSGAINVRGCIYDRDLTEYQVSSMLSKLPVIKEKEDFTTVQTCFRILRDCTKSADEVICGFYRRDISMLNQVYRTFKGTSINLDGGVFPIKHEIREMFYGVPCNEMGRASYKDLINFYDISIDDARDIACAIFGELYWEDLPASAIKAAIHVCARLNELGFDSAAVADAVITHMDNYYESGLAIPVVLERSVS